MRVKTLLKAGCTCDPPDTGSGGGGSGDSGGPM